METEAFREVSAAPVALYEAFKPYLLALLITLPRMTAFLTYSQMLVSSSAPRTARTAIILIIAASICPVNLEFAQQMPVGLMAFAALFAKEWIVGFLLGYCVAWIFWSIQAAGGIIDNQRGAAIAASIDPLQGHESSPLGNLFSQGFITYFMASGGFLMLLGLFMRSYVVWPPENFIPMPSPRLAEVSLEIIDLGMRTMLLLAAPILVIMFVSEFALALVSRFAPQIQVFILAMPIKSGIAVFMLIFYFRTLFEQTSERTYLVDDYFAIFYAILSPSGGGG